MCVSGNPLHHTELMYFYFYFTIYFTVFNSSTDGLLFWSVLWRHPGAPLRCTAAIQRRKERFVFLTICRVYASAVVQAVLTSSVKTIARVNIVLLYLSLRLFLFLWVKKRSVSFSQSVTRNTNRSGDKRALSNRVSSVCSSLNDSVIRSADKRAVTTFTTSSVFPLKNY